MAIRRRAHIINSDGSPLKRPDPVAEIIRPKRYGLKRKSWFKRILFIIGALILIYVGIIGAKVLGVVNKINVKNQSGASPLFKFPKITPEVLAGEGDGRINILLMGMGGSNHPGGDLTDTIMVASVDPKNNKIALLSIPRDLYVTYPKPMYGQGKINSVNAYGDQQKSKIPGGGPAMLKTEVSTILDLPIHYFIRADFSGFKNLVDTLGGVTVNVEKPINDTLYPAADMIHYDPFYLSAGVHQMNGDIALKFARSRETTSDFDRAHRQQQLLSAIKEKAMTIGVVANPKKIIDILNILGNHIQTDLTTTEMERLTSIIIKIPKDNILSQVLDNSPTGPLVSQTTAEGAYILLTKSGNYKEVQKIAHEIFTDPYIQDENAIVAVQNGSGVSGQGTDVATLLKDYNYDVVETVSTAKPIKQSVIYDLTQGKKPITIELMKKRLGFPVIISTPSSIKNITPKADIIVVVGQDYVAS